VPAGLFPSLSHTGFPTQILPGETPITGGGIRSRVREMALIHHQGIICGVVFDRSSLRRIAPYASVVAPRRLASNTLLVIRKTT